MLTFIEVQVRMCSNFQQLLNYLRVFFKFHRRWIINRRTNALQRRHKTNQEHLKTTALFYDSFLIYQAARPGMK